MFNVAGKSIENVRNFKQVHIVTNDSKLQRLTALPSFGTLRIFNENLAAVQMYRTEVTLNRPISVGFTILELAKLRTYDFYYGFVKPAFKDGSVSFLAGDTDSFVLKIDRISIEKVENILQANRSIFDFSNLPEKHRLKHDANRMVPGKVKFELGDAVCLEFCALSPKCYSMMTDKGFRQARKGSKREIKHELYKQCLLTDTCHTETTREVKTLWARVVPCFGGKKGLESNRHEETLSQSDRFIKFRPL